jgi:hypothetical protein
VPTGRFISGCDGTSLGGRERRRAGARVRGRVCRRQVEIGLTSFFSLAFGFTLMVFGLAMHFSTRYPVWLAAAGLLGGLATIAVGAEQAFHGFSNVALTLFMVVGLVDLIWAVVTGIVMWRLAPQLADADA